MLGSQNNLMSFFQHTDDFSKAGFKKGASCCHRVDCNLLGEIH